MTHHHLGTDAIHTVWDCALAPALSLRPGDTVTFDTLDASDGGVARRAAQGDASGPADLLALAAADAHGPRSGPRGHPLTGPVFVEGAEPGDALRVELLEVRTAAWGWTGCRPDGIGLLDAALGAEGLKPYTHLWDLRGGDHAEFLPGIRVPLAPFPGVLGVALGAPGPHPTAPPRRVARLLLAAGRCAHSRPGPVTRSALGRAAAKTLRFARPSLVSRRRGIDSPSSVRISGFGAGARASLLVANCGCQGLGQCLAAPASVAAHQGARGVGAPADRCSRCR